MVMYDYVCLAPGFAREVLDSYEAWEEKDRVPVRVRELMMVLRAEVSRLYGPPWEPEKAKIPVYKDVRLAE